VADRGTFRASRQIAGWRDAVFGLLWRPTYFNGGAHSVPVRCLARLRAPVDRRDEQNADQDESLGVLTGQPSIRVMLRILFEASRAATLYASDSVG
jgi:hypothetical protein